MVYPKRPDIVVGIDVGQTCTGVSYSIGPDWNDPRIINVWPGYDGDVNAVKVATKVGYDRITGELISWGFEADVGNQDIIIREHFKLTIDDDYEDDRFGYTCQEARRWYGDFLRKLQAEIERFFHKTIPQWHTMVVEYNFSTPTTWKDPAMIDSVHKLISASGFNVTSHRLVRMSLTEAEAAAIAAAIKGYTQGDVFMICDAGGGTTDVNLMQIRESQNGTVLDSLDCVEGVPIGSTLIDFYMIRHIGVRLEAIKDKLDERDPYVVAEEMLLRSRFQIAKHSFPKPNVGEIKLVIPGIADSVFSEDAGVERGQMKISRKVLKEVFDQQVQKIFDLVDQRLRHLEEEHPKAQVQYIILTGGFGSSPYLHEELERRYVKNSGFRSRNTASLRVMKFQEPQIAVAHGLVRGRTQMIGTTSSLGHEILPKRRCRNSYGVVIREPYDQLKHGGLRTAKDPHDGRFYVENLIDWIVKREEEIDVDKGVRRKYCATIKFGEQTRPRHVRVVMSSEAPDLLPRFLDGSGCREVVRINYTLTNNDMKLKNRQLWKLAKKFYRADFQFVVKLGPADLRFQILGKDNVLSTDHEQMEVEFLDPFDQRRPKQLLDLPPSVKARLAKQLNGSAVKLEKE